MRDVLMSFDGIVNKKDEQWLWLPLFGRFGINQACIPFEPIVKESFQSQFLHTLNMTPLEPIPSNPKRILVSIEGNIGSGKSTLINEFKGIPNIINEEQKVSSWDSLSKFYKDQQKYSLSLQIEVFTSYCMAFKKYFHSSKPAPINLPCEPLMGEFTHLLSFSGGQSDHTIKTPQSPLCETPDYEIVLMEGLLSTFDVFAKNSAEQGHLTQEQFKFVEDYCNPLSCGMIPSMVIYLDADPDTCMKRIHSRSRACEDSIQKEYIGKLHNKYSKLSQELSQKGIKMVRIDNLEIDKNKTFDLVKTVLKNTKLMNE